MTAPLLSLDTVTRTYMSRKGLFGTPAWHRERIAAAILEERP